MTIEITEELIAVAWEFGMADYIGPVYFKLLQEIVYLRNKVDDLQSKLSYHTDGNGYMDYYEY